MKKALIDFVAGVDAGRPARVSAYEEGRKAYADGLDFWENPHTHPSSKTELAPLWFAGWCNAKLVASKK